MGMAQDAPLIKMRMAGRLSNGFLLDLVKLGGFGRDVIDGVLLTAISQANVLPITRDPALQQRYATLDQPPPDQMRRPVSISAVANSLRIPIETARRRISAMAKLDIVRTSPRGVIIPQGPMDSPLYRMLSTAHYELVRNLYLRARPLELAPSAPSGPLVFSASAPPVRLVSRLSAHFTDPAGCDPRQYGAPKRRGFGRGWDVRRRLSARLRASPHPRRNAVRAAGNSV
jgi:hypothetical protein